MDERTESTFGHLLRSARERSGLTQEALAERAGLSADAIGLLERGSRRCPQRFTVQRLATALNLSDHEQTQFAVAARCARRSVAPAGVLAACPALPLPATTFVGRAQEIDELTRALATPGVRLVTLTGPGGVGKTRLALEVAVRLTDIFADGVAFVPLASLREPDLVPEAIVRALGVAAGGDRPPLKALTSALHASELLLILDNCEHLLPAAPLLADLLSMCPGLVVLATSRAPLRLSAERQYPVLPLVVPDPGGGPEAMARQPAVALFAQRAEAVAPGFALTADVMGVIAAICRRLDGLPLAIELAAAWVRILPPGVLLARLDHALPLLIGGARDQPARQRTLRGTLAWSYQLLAPDEQALLRRLAVFAGGWSLTAAEAVCTVGNAAVLPGLAALVDASLVQPPAPSTGAVSEPRYTLLETVREYAAELLGTSDEGEAVRRRHAAYFLSLVEEAQPGLVGPEEGVWLTRLDEERDNLRAALRWALDRGEVGTAVRLTVVLWRFWATRGYLSEGRRWMEEVLALSLPTSRKGAPTLPPLQQAMLLHVTANLARSQGDYTRAELLYEECLAIRREHDDWPGIIAALHNLGVTAHERGEDARAIQLFEAALPLAREVGEPYSLAFGLTAFGEAVRGGDPVRAVALHEEGLGWFSQIGHTWGIALALTRLGDAALAAGDPERAIALHRESLSLSGDLGDPRSTADALEGLAQAVVGTNPALVARLLGTAEALRDRLGAPRPPVRRADHERAATAARAALGDVAYATAHAAGAALPLEYALSSTDAGHGRPAEPALIPWKKPHS